MTDAQIREKIASVPTWYHRITIRPGIVTPGINDTPANLALLNLPQDCHGLRVLDLGARDGFFSFEMERRGAEVLAVDYVPAEETGFAVAAELLGSSVPYLHGNIYELTPQRIGTFDIVLFLGLLYHLPDPLGALRRIRSLCSGRLYVETLVIDGLLYLTDGAPTSLEQLNPKLRDLPLMQFFPGSSRNADATNFWGPNVRCVQDMLSDSEFLVKRTEWRVDRAVFECRVVKDEGKEQKWALATSERMHRGND